MSLRVLLIDAYNLIRRVYAAQDGEEDIQHLVNTIHSCSQSLQRALQQHKPSHAICIFKGHQATRRVKIYPQYKSGRSAVPEYLQQGLKDFQEVFQEIGIGSICIPEFECDDIIATLADKLTQKDGRVQILSTSQIYCQLLAPGVFIHDHFRNQPINEQTVQDKFHVSPDQLVDYWSLAGLSTYQLQGVPGIGPKTAIKLLETYGSLDKILASAEEIKGKPGKKLQEHREEALLTREVVSLQKNLHLGINLKDFRCPPL